MNISANDILDFWFEHAGPQKWFGQNDAFDAEIRNKFEDTAINAAADIRISGQHKWQFDPAKTLALLLLLDQFPRNMYRGTKGAFAWDDLALAVARKAVDQGYDLETDMSKRSFFFMPFMHAEDLAAQDECVRLVDMRLANESTLFHAKAHRELIKRFGRFPHRNEIVGRESTKAEMDYLRSGGYKP